MASKLPVDSEEIVARTVASFLQTAHPNATYHFDHGSGVQLTKTQAIKQMLLNGRRGHPDLVIYAPRGPYVGLAIELKRDGERIYTQREHKPVSDHVAEQIKFLGDLQRNGWYAVFGIGAPDTIELIDAYLKGQLNPENQ